MADATVKGLWGFLGRNVCLLFGQESYHSFLSMSIVLLVRLLSIITGLRDYLPEDLILGLLPVLILSTNITGVASNRLLAVRLAESVMG